MPTVKALDILDQIDTNMGRLPGYRVPPGSTQRVFVTQICTRITNAISELRNENLTEHEAGEIIKCMTLLAKEVKERTK